MKKYLFAVLIFSLFTACQSDKRRTSLATEIETLQQEIGKESRPSTEQLNKFKTALVKYASNYPDDSLSIKYLSKAGEAARLLQQFDEAIRIYDRIAVQYPKHPESAKALFMKGFMYENDLGKLDSAKMIYNLFLEKYPDDDFADDARFLLNNLGKKPEEILKEFGEQ